jgi:lipopolysaccharide transport system ATP-binding protein
VRITRIAAYSNSSSNTVLATGRPARFVFDLDARRTGLSCSFTLYDHLGQPITFFDSGMHGPEDRSDPAGQAQFVCEIDALPLLPGRYRMNAAVMHNGIMQDHLEAATFVDVADGQLSGRPVPQDTGYGSILIAHRWIIPT